MGKERITAKDPRKAFVVSVFRAAYPQIRVTQVTTDGVRFRAKLLKYQDFLRYEHWGFYQIQPEGHGEYFIWKEGNLNESARIKVTVPHV